MSLLHARLPTIKQLQCFLAVAQELNFRRAADRLSMTQPPLTRQIQCLEDIVGSRLFIRDSHQVCLTEEGAALKKQVSELLGRLAEVIANARGDNGKISIGTTRTLDFSRIAAISRTLASLVNPDDIVSYQLTSKQLLHRLAQGDLDIILTGEQPVALADEVVFHWLHQEPLMLALPSAHPATVKPVVTLPQVADLPLYWFNRRANPAFYDKCEAVFRCLPVSLKRLPEPDDSLLTLANVARGKGMALMPESMCVSMRQGLCYRPLDAASAKKLNIDVYIGVRKEDHRPQVMAALEKMLANGR